MERRPSTSRSLRCYASLHELCALTALDCACPCHVASPALVRVAIAPIVAPIPPRHGSFDGCEKGEVKKARKSAKHSI
jgi:hypothetical protein